ncbi:MAG: lysophospholipid acyltransferase family protein [Parvularculaceae bacterium]
MTFLRSGLFTLYLFLFSAVLTLPAAPAFIIGENSVRRVTKFWSRGVLGGLKLICGVSYRVEGSENIPAGGATVASNHQSMWETIALYALLPRPVMVLKKELLRIPIYGWWVKLSGNIVVDRKAGAKAMRGLTRDAAASIAEGKQVVVFPEGTRIAPGARGEFQPGIAGIYKAAGAPCVPVAHDSGRHWRHPGILKIPGEITIRFLPPIEPGMDRKDFLSMLKAQIESARRDLSGDSQARYDGAEPAALGAASRS